MSRKVIGIVAATGTVANLILRHIGNQCQSLLEDGIKSRIKINILQWCQSKTPANPLMFENSKTKKLDLC